MTALEHFAKDAIFRAQLHQSLYENFGDDDRHHYREHSHYWGAPLLWGVLGLIAVIALVSFIFAHIFVIAGVVAVLALIAAYHRGHDPFDLDPRDYRNDQRPTSPPREAAH